MSKIQDMLVRMNMESVEDFELAFIVDGKELSRAKSENGECIFIVSHNGESGVMMGKGSDDKLYGCIFIMADTLVSAFGDQYGLEGAISLVDQLVSDLSHSLMGLVRDRHS